MLGQGVGYGLRIWLDNYNVETKPDDDDDELVVLGDMRLCSNWHLSS